MTKISEAFQHGKAFIPYIACGDPDLATTEEVVKACVDAGADLIELGIPFSDPTAEGPVIQAASARALKGGATTDKIFAMVRNLRQTIEVPMVFMTYANVVYSYGSEKFIQICAEIGINGLILPDVPFEEKEEFALLCRQYELDFISLIAPSSQQRISLISDAAEGFVYVVSSLGVTGVRKEITTDISAMIQLVKKANPTIPAAVGFGISTPQQAKDMAQEADGVIVGSAIVNIIAEHGKEAAPYVRDYVKQMKEAIDL